MPRRADCARASHFAFPTEILCQLRARGTLRRTFRWSARVAQPDFSISLQLERRAPSGGEKGGASRDYTTLRRLLFGSPEQAIGGSGATLDARFAQAVDFKAKSPFCLIRFFFASRWISNQSACR